MSFVKQSVTEQSLTVLREQFNRLTEASAEIHEPIIHAVFDTANKLLGAVGLDEDDNFKVDRTSEPLTALLTAEAVMEVAKLLNECADDMLRTVETPEADGHEEGLRQMAFITRSAALVLVASY